MKITNEQILKYEKYINTVARSHVREVTNQRNLAYLDDKRRVFNVLGQTVEDIAQELRFAAFLSLRDFYVTLNAGEVILIPEDVYVKRSIKDRKRTLIRDMYALSQGQSIFFAEDMNLFNGVVESFDR